MPDTLYQAPDNIYWLFSSSAQAIAAFIGFLSAGFFFVYDRMEKEVEKDETLEEIYTEIKSTYYNLLRTLFILTGLSITLSLLIVFMNGFDLGLIGVVSRWIVAVVNITTIGWAIAFVISIVDPNKIQKAAKKLMAEDPNVEPDTTGSDREKGNFLVNFGLLEREIRRYANLKQIPSPNDRFIAFRRIVDRLFEQQYIFEEDYGELAELIRVRNLISHGGSASVNRRLLNSVVRLKEKFAALNE